MTCGCGRSPDGCRGWHALTEEEYQIEYAKYLEEKRLLLAVLGEADPVLLAQAQQQLEENRAFVAQQD